MKLNVFGFQWNTKFFGYDIQKLLNNLKTNTTSAGKCIFN